jgi:hypothetical protein
VTQLKDPAVSILSSIKIATAEKPLTKADEDANKAVLVAATAERLKVWVRPATTADIEKGKAARITAWQERYGATVTPAEEKPVEGVIRK